jgi:hypothetical protein
MDATFLPALLPPDQTWQGVADRIPPTGTLVLYRTAYYQMMGYVNRLGLWIGSDGEEEAFPVQWWREIGGDLARWPASSS